MQMRRDFLTYFEDPCLIFVVGIIVFGSSKRFVVNILVQFASFS